jgi:DNA primase
MSDQVEEVKSKTDIVAVIGEHINLKKAGRNFMGLCPFHNEKTPSFNVSPELQIYKCFGCNAAGDVFTFLQEYEGMEFYEALKFLAEKTGVKLKPLTGKREAGIKERLYEVNSWVADFYHFILTKHESGKRALDYLLSERGLKRQTIDEFKLGFCPDVPLALKRYIIDKKEATVAELQQAGIVYQGQGQVVDRFRGRVIFPLFDHRGNTIAFAGRAMPGREDVAKYINSPETPIYHKSRVLFGLNLTRSEIKRRKEVVIVEGELDMISCWQAGIKHVVAIKGSVLTPEQSQLLSRYAQNVVLALDADIAGDAAARRGIEIAEKEGLEVKVAVIKDYKDPDELARNNPELLKKTIERSVSVWDFIIDSIFSRYDAATGAGKAKISKEIIPVLTSIRDPIVQAHYSNIAAGRLNVPLEAVTGQLKPQSDSGEEVSQKSVKGKDRREMLEERLLTCAFRSDPDILLKDDIKSLFSYAVAQRIIEEYKDHIGNAKKFDLGVFAKKLPAELAYKFSDLILTEVEGIEGESTATHERELALVVRQIRVDDLRKRREKLVAKIRNYENENKTKELKKLSGEFNEIGKLLKKLEEENNKGIML